VWDAATGTEVLRIKHTNDPLQYTIGVAYSPDGIRLATASASAAFIWNAATGARLLEINHTGVVGSVAFSPDGSRIVTTCGDRASVWDAATGTAQLEIRSTGLLDRATFSPDGMWLLTGGQDAIAQIWDATEGSPLLQIPHKQKLHDVAFGFRGGRLATVSGSETTLWAI
jgi:WD40 repeat protein